MERSMPGWSEGGRSGPMIRSVPGRKPRIHPRIGELMREKKIEGIAEVRDESDRDGIRLVIELKKDVVPQVVINQLYRLTDLQTSFGVINLAIVGGQPRVLPLKDLLAHFVSHRREVVGRRTRFELREAEERFNTLLGLIVAVDHIDRVIDIIRQLVEVALH